MTRRGFLRSIFGAVLAAPIAVVGAALLAEPKWEPMRTARPAVVGPASFGDERDNYGFIVDESNWLRWNCTSADVHQALRSRPDVIFGGAAGGGMSYGRDIRISPRF